MALILDSSLLVGAERTGKNAKQALTEIAWQVAGQDVAISVVTLVEMAHGVARANTPERKAQGDQFLRELVVALPVHPVTVGVALRAGQIDGENNARGDSTSARGLTHRRDGAGVGLSSWHCKRAAL